MEEKFEDGKWHHITLHQTGKNPIIQIWDGKQYLFFDGCADFAVFNWCLSQTEITYCCKYPKIFEIYAKIKRFWITRSRNQKGIFYAIIIGLIGSIIQGIITGNWF